jgi:hypothetical protein
MFKKMGQTPSYESPKTTQYSVNGIVSEVYEKSRGTCMLSVKKNHCHSKNAFNPKQIKTEPNSAVVCQSGTETARRPDIDAVFNTIFLLK